MNKEDFFISKISKDSKVIGDDGAFIDNFVYSQDAFFENIHFKKSWFSLEQIAKKSMLVNISDAIAMNAKPKYALITLAIPKNYTREMLEKLADGFLEVAKQFNIDIIGGDTIANSKLDISITIISKTKNPIYRKGLKRGNLLAYSGFLGESKRDLNRLFKGFKISKDSKFIEPKLHDEFFYKISKYVTCALDISDGLFFELDRIGKLNRLSFDFFEKIDKSIGTSGEEYELLFGFDKRYRAKIENLAKKYRVKLTIFAKAKRGRYKNSSKNHHF